MTTRRISVAALAGIAAAMGGLSTAWACTGQPQVFSVSPLTAPAGAEVTLRGTGATVTAPVELHWHGVAGPKLATVAADSRAEFALSFTVPDVAPGVYSLVLVNNQAGAMAVGRTAFEVSGADLSAASAPAPANNGFASATEAAGLRSSSGSSTALLAGVGLLAFGSVALVGGFGVATARRRRAPSLSAPAR